MRSGTRTWLVAGFAIALAGVAAALVSQLGGDASGPRPDVVLGSGSHEGLDWIYGYDVDEPFSEEGPCFQLVIEESTSGCGRDDQPVETLSVYHSTGGNPHGVLTAEGIVSNRVARVECGTGPGPVGETYLFEAPAGEARPVLCLATADEIAGRQWFAFAFDVRNRQLAKEEIAPRR